MGEALSTTTRFGDAGAIWLEQASRPEHGLAASTLAQYQATWGRVFAGAAFYDLTLSEANRVPRIRAFLQGVADERGSGSAATARSIVSSVLTLAVLDGVLDANAARLVRTPRRSTVAVAAASPRDKALIEAGWTWAQIQPDRERAFTSEQRATLVAKTRADEETNGFARRADVADLVAFMAAVGPRIEETLATRWEDVDFAAGTVRVPGTKTETSDRTLRVATWLLERLRVRHELEGHPRAGFIFHSTVGGLEDRRDRRNTSRALRRVFDTHGVPWAVPHTFRRTVATLLDQAGVPLAQIADYLGHADPAMTARVYLGRKADTSRAASVL